MKGKSYGLPDLLVTVPPKYLTTASVRELTWNAA